jgi:hypothetical protein
LAHSSLSTPQETLSRVRSLFEQLQNSLPADAGKRLHKLQLESSFKALVEGAYKQIASQSPEAASQYFDALSDSEKTKLTAEEIRNRVSHGGSKAAFNLAEKLQSPTNQITAGQVISQLISEKDKPAMLGWIHSLPDSEFRRGVLKALDSDTGALLQSSKDRIDFFAAKDTRPEEVERLPLTNEEKALLLQKVAPIPLP